MHMASTLVSAAVAGTMGVGSGGAFVASGRALKKKNTNNSILMGVTGAGVFAAQMMNFSIIGTGSSGHIGGGLLLATLLGPVPAYIVMSIILTVQCLLFGDGGLLALGCNIFNMGIIPCFVIYPIINKLLLHKGTMQKHIGIVLGGMLSMIIGALAVVAEAAISGGVGLNMKAFFINMLLIHIAIGFAEGVISAVLISAYEKAKKHSQRFARIATGVFATITGGFLSLYASAFPDGLEWSILQVAGTTELTTSSSVHTFFDAIQNVTTLLPDYTLLTIESVFSSSAAGLIGCVAVFIIAWIYGALLGKISNITA